MNSHEFFEELVDALETMQAAIDKLRNVVKQKIAECTSPKEDKLNE